jgi:hypothetical protein
MANHSAVQRLIRRVIAGGFTLEWSHRSQVGVHRLRRRGAWDRNASAQTVIAAQSAA